MKSRFYILLLILFTFNCSLDDSTQQNTNPKLKGSWSLVNVSGGFTGSNNNFEVGLITWEFTDAEIIVTNNNTNAIQSGYVTGIYSYEVITTVNDTTLVIGNTNNYLKIKTLTDSELIIEHDNTMVIHGNKYTLNR